MLVVDVFFSVIEADNLFASEGVNCVHDSTFHILLIWAIQKLQNTIYLNRYLAFMKIFCKRASNLTLINSFLKTNLLADLSTFALHNLFGGQECEPVRMDTGWFFRELTQEIRNIELRTDCAVFFRELKKTTSWKYLSQVSSEAWSMPGGRDSYFAPKKKSVPLSKSNVIYYTDQKNGGKAYKVGKTASRTEFSPDQKVIDGSMASSQQDIQFFNKEVKNDVQSMTKMDSMKQIPSINIQLMNDKKPILKQSATNRVPPSPASKQEATLKLHNELNRYPQLPKHPSQAAAPN
jgi:hypothetical protein